MKKRGFLVSSTAAVIAATVFVGLQIAAPSWAGFRTNPKELVDEVWQIINRDFVDATFNEVDWEETRRDLLATSYATDTEAFEAINDALETLDDPYTRFMDPEQFASMRIDTSGELTGVGIQLGADQDTGQLVVVSPIEDSPAFEAGILSRDVITAIDGISTEDMDINAAVALIRGESGTDVTLNILRNETEELEFTITRDTIELLPVRYETRTENGQTLGYVRLLTFSANASEYMRTALEALEAENVDGYMLDLRGNPGGLLYSSAEIARMFMDEGDIVSTVNRRGVQDVLSANNAALTDQPLVVLVDGGSASASEILAGALQDNNRATLVGSQTFGKGLVQSVHSLSGGAGLAVTIARYRTPNGTDIDHKGITPDITVELTEADIERLTGDRELLGTTDDPQYAAALRSLQDAIASEAGAVVSEAR